MNTEAMKEEWLRQIGRLMYLAGLWSDEYPEDSEARAVWRMREQLLSQALQGGMQ